MRNLDKVSVVILNYNSCEDTIQCAENIRAIGCGIQIIIVDNVSPDDSYQKLAEKYAGTEDITVLKTDKNGGYSYGNNFGMKYAIEHFGAEYLGIINPDVIITDKELIHDMCDVLDKHDDIAVVGASVLDADGKYNINSSGWQIPTASELIRYHFLINNRKKKNAEFEKNGDLFYVECVAGCFFIAKATVMAELGFFDENVFLYNEENILGIKCKRKDYREAVLADRYYIHNHKKNTAPMPLRKKINVTGNIYRSTKYVCRTYYSKALLPLLALTEAMNKVYLLLAYAKNSLVRKV